jgi:hypothetical protein
MTSKCNLVDDDGVLIISTTRQMEFWKDQAYEYDFPSEVIGHMREGRIVAWESGGEDDHSVEVRFLTVAPTRDKRTIGPFLLTALLDDHFIAMPYSQFTYAADCAEGEVTDVAGLAFKIPIDAGAFHVYITKIEDANWIVQLLREDGSPLAPIQEALPEVH